MTEDEVTIERGDGVTKDEATINRGDGVTEDGTCNYSVFLFLEGGGESAQVN